MQVIDCIQQTPEWFLIRKGIPTASCFSQIITSTGKLSASLDKYLALLIAESKLMAARDWIGNEHTERGNLLEPEARRAYEWETDTPIEIVGFVKTDDGKFGCSPDGFIDGRKGGIEIKCPKPEIHIEYCMKDRLPPTYAVQVHGSMVVTGCDYWDFMSYAEGADPFIKRIERDDFTAKVSDALDEFYIKLEAARKQFGVTIEPNKS